MWILRRVDAEVRPEVGHVLGLGEFGHLRSVDHPSNLLSVPSIVNGGAGVVRIPVRIIPKGVLFFEAKWCADFSDTPLLTCGYIVFRGGVRKSVFLRILFPLDGLSSAVPSFQLRPVFDAVSRRVPPDDTTSRFVGFGDNSWDSFKNSLQTQSLEFSFLSQGAQRAALRGSISTKTPVLKLKCLFACEPPAAIGSKSTQVACP